MRVTFHGTLLAVILIVLAMMAIGPARQWYQEQQTIQADQATLAAGNAKANRLNTKLQQLQDPAYVESVAREELGYVAPGETSYIVSHRLQQAPQLGQVAQSRGTGGTGGMGSTGGTGANSAPAGSPTPRPGPPSFLGKVRTALDVMPLP